jgi:ABC-type sugar transport system permease subunit
MNWDSSISSAAVTLPERAPTRRWADRFWVWQQRGSRYLFLLPMVAVLSVFFLWPLWKSLTLSLYTTAGPKTQRFVGMENYTFLILHDRLFWLAVANTIAFTVAFLVVQIPASLGLAILLNHKKVRARGVLRFCFFSTHLIGQVFIAVVFFAILGPHQGLANKALHLIGGPNSEIDWLISPQWALFSTLIAAWWLSIGYGMIYFLAALQTVDMDLYEAAELDGAGRWQAFWSVTLPGIRPVLIFLVIVGTIGGFQLFELPYVLFHGPGPSYRVLTIVMYLYSAGFDQGDLGYAAAIGWVLVLILGAVALVQLKIFGALAQD